MEIKLVEIQRSQSQQNVFVKKKKAIVQEGTGNWDQE